MTINDIQELIANGEHRSLELKKSTGELKDGMHTACAFLNTGGGWLIFGISPSSLKIIGQNVTDATQREIAQALAGIEPAVDVRVEYIPVQDADGSKVIAIHFEAYVWGKPPYTFHGCPYYKVESTTMRMPRDMFTARLITANVKMHSWEQQVADRITFDDLNQDRVKNAVMVGVEAGRINTEALHDSVYNILNKWSLLTKDGQPNNAAALLFGTKSYIYPQFKLQMARFVGNTKREFLDMINANGNLFELLDAGTAFFFKHLFQSGKVVGFIREDRLEIPAEALRETFINALCHRQWEKINQTITIAIFDDRVEISNPGILPPDLPVEQLKQPHNSYPYNPIIADVLFQIKMLEKWGTGVNRIIEVCHEYNVPEPEWTNNGGRITVTFKRTNTYVGQLSDKVGNKVSNKVSNKVGNKVTALNDRQKAIIAFCMIPRSRREIFEHINLAWQTKHFNRYIKPLINCGLLVLTQPDSPSSPTQKYVVATKKTNQQ